MAEPGVLPVGVSDSVPKDRPAKDGVPATIAKDSASRAGWQSAASGRGGWDGARGAR